MPKLKTITEAYDLCVADGCYRRLNEINIEKIKSLMENAQININSANIIAKTIDNKAKEWMNVYTLYYESMRIYAETLLIFLSIEATNHECLFAALCIKYPDLELDWNFFIKIRTKRNGINYYGEQITFADWKSIEVQIQLYISMLKKELKKMLK